jgi:hypothetical protein
LGLSILTQDINQISLARAIKSAFVKDTNRRVIGFCFFPNNQHLFLLHLVSLKGVTVFPIVNHTPRCACPFLCSRRYHAEILAFNVSGAVYGLIVLVPRCKQYSLGYGQNLPR